MNFVPFINIPPADHLPSIEGGRVVAELREADSFTGLFPCRPKGVSVCSVVKWRYGYSVNTASAVLTDLGI